MLADGMRVWLGSASAFDEHFDPALRRLRLIAGDTDQALQMLGAILPVQVRQPLPWWTTLEARGATARR